MKGYHKKEAVEFFWAPQYYYFFFIVNLLLTLLKTGDFS